MQVIPSRDLVRNWFPALQSDFAFLENAGGSQMPGIVADAIRDYMLTSYVQIGAGYTRSEVATLTVSEAHAFIETFMNAGEVGKAVLGPSTTALIQILADAYSHIWTAGDEVIVAESNHEANAGPWAKLERLGIVVKTWPIDPLSFELTLSSLGDLLTPRTKMVAFPHVSNLLGEVVDIKAITDLVHQAGGKVIADGVAYAPHRAMDVKNWGVDWYVYSTYKVYGPHMAALYGTHEAFAELTGPNHFFIPKDAVPYKFELGSLSHEGCAGLLALRPYLRFLAGREIDDRQTIVRAYEVMELLETPLQARLLEYLRSKSQVKIIGLGDTGSRSVGTISFVHSERSSSEIVAHIDRNNIGIRFGHMYAVRLCNALGIDLETGVVRVSLVHYNTPEEIERLIRCFEEIL